MGMQRAESHRCYVVVFLGHLFNLNGTCLKLFAQQRSLQFIFWAEDDCESRNQSNAKSVLEAAQAISPSAGWLGYLRVNGEPRWQSHMVSFTRWSATAMLHDLNELWSGHAAPADFSNGFGHLYLGAVRAFRHHSPITTIAGAPDQIVDFWSERRWKPVTIIIVIMVRSPALQKAVTIIIAINMITTSSPLW